MPAPPPPPNTAPPPPPAPPAFRVQGGPCTVSEDGQCVGRPNGYQDGESCSIVATRSFALSACPLFDTEGCCDHVVIDGQQFSGTSCPAGVHVSQDSSISWSSDGSVHSGSGWQICGVEGPGGPPTCPWPAHSSVYGYAFPAEPHGMVSHGHSLQCNACACRAGIGLSALGDLPRQRDADRDEQCCADSLVQYCAPGFKLLPKPANPPGNGSYYDPCAGRSTTCCVPFDGEETPRDDQLNRVLTTVGDVIQQLAGAISTTAAGAAGGHDGASYQQSQVSATPMHRSMCPRPFATQAPRRCRPLTPPATDRAGPEPDRLRSSNVQLRQRKLGERRR